MSPCNLNIMCRICGELFNNRFETVQANENQIYKYLPIKKTDKGFPRNICMDCLSSVEKWDIFYRRCEESQKKFSSILKGKRTNNDSNKESDETVPNNIKERTDAQDAADGNKKRTTQIDLNLSCNFCKVHNTSQQQLNDHLIAVHCDLVFCCDLCKNYKPRDDLITHMTEHALSSLQSSTDETSTATTNKFQCPECEKQFSSNSGLKYHMNSNHTTAKQFPCDECEHVFPSKRVLLNHYRSVHSKDKQFKCNECDKRFKTDSTLYAHRKTHSKETPFKCFDCGKGFKFKHHLDAHSQQHRPPQKTFECNCCHKKFAALNNLTKHRKIHDKTTDFVCHICGVKMMQKRYLRDHMKRVHQTRLDSLETVN